MGVKIFSASRSIELATKIAECYGTKVSNSEFKIFSDGEFCHGLEDNVRGQKVFIVASLYSFYGDMKKILDLIPEDKHPEAEKILKRLISSSSSVMELLEMIDAAKRASSKDIVAVLPYFGFARQDRKHKSRVPITAKLLADIIQAAGATRIMTIDLHADQISAFFDIPVDALNSSYVFMPYIATLGLKNMIFGAPDEGSGKRTKPYAEHFKTRMIFMYKERSEANMIDRMELIGDVNGCDVIFIDDILDTGGTICSASDILMNKKGAKSVRACIPHAIFSGPALDRIEKSKISEIITTDTIPLFIKSDKIKVLSVSELIAKSIQRMNNNESISDLFKK